MADPVAGAARTAAAILASDHGPRLAAEVEAALATRGTSQRPGQYLDLTRTQVSRLGKRVGGNASRVRISHPPLDASCSAATLAFPRLAEDNFRGDDPPEPPEAAFRPQGWRARRLQFRS